MDKHLHIVCLDIPYPADYGGVVDLFYKIKSLHHAGIKIHLHCFTGNRKPQAELDKYCESVQYYQRKRNAGSFSFSTPLIVKSRADKELINNLQKDNYPVLLEGIHCTWYLKAGQLAGRKVVVRLHNAEFAYYRQLAMHERNLFKKLYYLHESRLLKKYENAIASKAVFLAVSREDADLYKRRFKAANIHYLPVFIPGTTATSAAGKGCFCLYHGNLAVNENEEAATWLLRHVFNNLSIPLVIAGKNPSRALEQLAHKHQHTCLVANPGEKEMQDMIAKAHVHVLPSFNNTGIKLKLLNAIFNGRHCLVNEAAVAGSGLEPFCVIAADETSFQQKLGELYQLAFTEEQIRQRQQLLQTVYNNEVNAGELIKFLW